MNLDHLLYTYDGARINILVNLSLPSLLSLCSINITLNKLCQEEWLWRERCINDFPYNIVQYDVSWQTMYIHMYKSSKLTSVYYDGVLINRQLLYHNMPSIHNKIMNLFIDKFVLIIYTNECNEPIICSTTDYSIKLYHDVGSYAIYHMYIYNKIDNSIIIDINQHNVIYNSSTSNSSNVIINYVLLYNTMNKIQSKLRNLIKTREVVD